MSYVCLLIVFCHNISTVPTFPISLTSSSDFINDDGSRRLLELAEEFENVFPSYDISGQRITSTHSHYRMLTTNCPSNFVKPCNGSCNSCGSVKATALCKARKLRCKASTVKGEIFISLFLCFAVLSDTSSLNPANRRI